MNKFSVASNFVSQRLVELAICASVCCMAGLATTACLAQDAAVQYKTIPTNAKFKDIDLDGLPADRRREASKQNSESRRARTEAKSKARDGIQSGNIAAAKDYLNGFVYPRMTQPDQLSDAGTMRDSFFRTYLRSDLSAQARKQLISTSILPAMQTIANGKDYYPAARLNAIAVIGRLDDRALTRNGSSATPPIPSAEAFTFLSGALSSLDVPPYLKAGAMQGITRHLKIDRAAQGRLLDDGARNKLLQFAINTIDGKSPGQDKWKPELDYWLKRRSVQLIGDIGIPGPDGQNIDLLIKIATDDTQTLWMKFDAIKSLRLIDFTSISADKASAVVSGVTSFLQSSLDGEAARIQGLVDELVYKNILYGDTDLEITGTRYERNVGKSGGTMGGMMGGMMDDFDDGMMEGPSFGSGMGGINNEEPVVLIELPTYQLNLIRRRMKILAFTCNDVINNAKGLATVTGEKEKKLVSEVSKFTAKFMRDSSTGIVDLDEMMTTEEPQQVSYTQQLQAICKAAADTVKSLLASYKGDAGANPGAAPGPVIDPSDPLNGLGG